MSIKRYTTESGSIWTIDAEKKTWHRVRGPDAPIIRSDEGTFFSEAEDWQIGDQIYLYCPPFDPSDFKVRQVNSSPIVKVEELNGNN